MIKRLREKLRGLPKWLVAAGAVGLTVAGLDTAMHVTSQNEFCAYCHANNATAEWRESVHYSNASGAEVSCAQCHIPDEFIPKLTVKIKALGDVWSFMQGTIDTPEKYEARRPAMAQRVWDSMIADGSRACMSCHAPERMANPEMPHLRSTHLSSLKDGEPCIECHKGMAHKPPPEPDEEGVAQSSGTALVHQGHPG